MGWFRRNEHDEVRLSAYLDGELDSRQAEIVENHLSVCDACAALLEEMRDTKTMLTELPALTPRRSFVLGDEYARAPARAAPASRRFSLALAPAAALTVFVALLFVDLAGNTSTSSDESANTFTAASAPEMADDASAGGESAGASSLAPDSPPGPSSDGAPGKAAADAPEPNAPPAASEGAQGASAAAGAAQQAEAPALRSSGTEATPAQSEAAIAAEEEQPSPEPFVVETPASDDGDGGFPTLRLLQVLAGAVFLASGFYVFVWPRVSGGGS